MNCSLRSHLPPELTLSVVDIGAAAIDGPAPYAPLVGAQGGHVLGFEPNQQALARLNAQGTPRATWLGDAVGNGTPGVLKLCRIPGMSSLLEPDMDILQHFHGFPQWAEVIERVPMETRALDAVPEAAAMDYLKIDVQGGELGVLKGAVETLKQALVVQLEVQFVPFYKDQPLFGDLDAALREAGFYLHTFMPIHTRILKPLVIQGDPYAGLHQALWSDAVYVRRFTDFPTMKSADLMKIAWLAHDLYQSYDLAAMALKVIDEREGTQRQAAYLTQLTAKKAA